MKKFFFLLVIFVFQIASHAQNIRVKTDIGQNWKFALSLSDNTPAQPSYVDTQWEIVNIPHTWNNADGQDGGNNYLRTTGWYRKNIAWQSDWTGKKIFIEFQAVNTQSWVYVNGVLVGNHKGGYSAFRFDISAYLTNGDNLIAVKVNNEEAQDIAPISADFTFFGGIYREVSILAVDPVHVDLMDNGSNGLYLTTTNVSKTSANLSVKSKILNESATAKSLTVKTTLRYPDTFEEVPGITKIFFDVNSMKPGGPAVLTFTNQITVGANGSYTFTKDMVVLNPRLWNGKTDPFRYIVDIEVLDGTTIIDKVSDYVGFRNFWANRDGFFLNGNYYPLRGVNRHQDRLNKGNALTVKEHDEDFKWMYEMGTNSVRLAHYPHSPYFYDLCDKYGIVVWAEIPFVDHHGSASNFADITKQQLKELIRQHYNRPAILMWGLQNEVKSNYDSQMRNTMKALNDLAHTEDPSRYTVQATNHTTAYNWPSDLMARNIYPGWYVGGSLYNYIKDYLTRSQPTGISEYGSGGCISQQELYAGWPQHNGTWHPEEYQTSTHEWYLSDINAQPKVWGTFQWNLFDFASDWRNEGELPGRNTKGLITYDRKVAKDAYYVYKANWNPDPMVHITRRRHNPMPQAVIPLTFYSNCNEVEVFLRGVSLGRKMKSEVSNCIFKWADITLVKGENQVVVKGYQDGKVYADTVVWNKELSSVCELNSTILRIDNVKQRVVLTGNIDVNELPTVLTAKYGGSYKIVNEDGISEVKSGLLMVGMKILVTAENDIATSVYNVVTDHLALGKPVYADSYQSANPPVNAVDMNGATRWAANDANSHYLEVDLGDIYNLNKIDISWFNNTAGTRYYRYKVYVADNSKSYVEVIDRSNNTASNTVSDPLSQKAGRWVKVQILSSNDASAYPSFYEFEVYGWKLESSKYLVDHTTKTIYINNSDFEKNIQISEFISNLSFVGQGNLSVVADSYFIQLGDKLQVKDINGNITEYTIESTNVQIYAISQGKIVSASGQEGIDDSGSKNLITYINDGDLSTRWAAPKRNGAAVYPEWAIVDLGKVFNLSEIEVYFYKWGENDRAYRYELLGSTTNTNSFDLLTDRKSNTDLGGHFKHLYSATKSRYIKLNVTGCSNTAAWAVASVQEIIIRGYDGQNTGLSTLQGIGRCWVKNNTIHFESLNSTDALIRVYDGTGREICNQKVNGKFEKQFTSGVYILTISGTEGNSRIKIVL